MDQELVEEEDPLIQVGRGFLGFEASLVMVVVEEVEAEVEHCLRNQASREK